MRRVVTPLIVVATLAMGAPAAFAQAPGQSRADRDQQRPGAEEPRRSRAPRIAPLRRQAAAGPCPFVKILYDAARYVELDTERAAIANVGYTGEIQGLSAGCSYQNDDPITVQVNLLFGLGRGPQATAEQRTYRYWIAVTERNTAVLAKEYFDLPVNFEGARTAEVTQEQTIVIPRAEATTSGGNFEILVGFEVSPEMAEFNRSGSRFRVNAGTTTAQ